MNQIMLDPSTDETNAAPLKAIAIAVAGNPNAGKSTLINGIAGTRLHVGNWPGVTVEKKEANLEYADKKLKFVDLPGIYSLSPYSEEEVIARDYLIREKPDVIINVVDSTNLERNLYLTVQLLEIGIPIIIALNVYDEAEKKGFIIDADSIEEMLGVVIVKTIATKKVGFEELLKSAIAAAENTGCYCPKRLKYDEDIELAVESVMAKLTATRPLIAKTYPLKWLALKILENDKPILDELNIDTSDFFNDPAVIHLKKSHGDDIESFLGDERYALASGLTREVLKKPLIKKTELTEQIDNIVLNRYLGVPIFIGLMWLVFKLTFDISTPFIDWIDSVTSGPVSRWAERGLTAMRLPDWLTDLFIEGVVGGVGFVFVFLPVIFAMMFLITFLEGSGYMARAAFVMDRAMHTIGLHGKSFIPLILGFGCNVPAVYATRTLENTRDRVLTVLLIPLMSCGARLPVYVLFVGAFFPNHSGTVLWSLYLLGILLAMFMGVIFKSLLFKGESPMFIMELPPYRVPTLGNLLIHTWEKGKHFLIKAGTYILLVSIVVWFFLNLPWGVVDKKDSFLGQAGHFVAPALSPLGFGDWEAASSLITGVVAKEIIVGTMGVIYAAQTQEEKPARPPTLGEDLKDMGLSLMDAVKNAAGNVFSTFGIASLSTESGQEDSSLRKKVRQTFTPLSAYAFMVFVLLYMPCMVVAIAIKQEFGSWKWFGLAVAYQTTLAWISAFIIYQGGKLVGLDS
jgi:ferrous iron transport protein B